MDLQISVFSLLTLCSLNRGTTENKRTSGPLSVGNGTKGVKTTQQTTPFEKGYFANTTIEYPTAETFPLLAYECF